MWSDLLSRLSLASSTLSIDVGEAVLKPNGAISASLSRDLHDHFGQKLAASRHLVAVLERQVSARHSGGATGASDLEDTVRALDLLLADLQRTLKGFLEVLSPQALEHGLACAVNALVDEFRGLFPAVVFRVSIDPFIRTERLSSDVEITIYRFVQEGLHNVVSHAAATTAWVTLGANASDTPTSLVAQIRDDGSGLERTHLQRDGRGIAGMRERAIELGGRFLAETLDSGGTSITMTLPVGIDPQ